MEEEEPDEEQEKEEDTSSSEEDGEANNDDEPDRWSPLRKNVGVDLRETYMKEVQQFLDN